MKFKSMFNRNIKLTFLVKKDGKQRTIYEVDSSAAHSSEKDSVILFSTAPTQRQSNISSVTQTVAFDMSNNPDTEDIQGAEIRTEPPKEHEHEKGTPFSHIGSLVQAENVNSLAEDMHYIGAE
eukprot:11101830-Ditylum_brightwellii.AAC.1